MRDADIQWSSYSYPSTRLYQSFMDCIMENALTQHVIVPTRGTNVLDLILSTDPMVVSRVTAGDYFRFLDKVSDHSALLLACAITHHSYVQSIVLEPCSRLIVQNNEAIDPLRWSVDGATSTGDVVCRLFSTTVTAVVRGQSPAQGHNS